MRGTRRCLVGIREAARKRSAIGRGTLRRAAIGWAAIGWAAIGWAAIGCLTLIGGVTGCAEGREPGATEPQTRDGCWECHVNPSGPAVPGAPHDSHSTYACTACHIVPGDWRNAGHLEDRGVDDVVFGALATLNGAHPIWDGETCSSVYCHGATLTGGTSAALAWSADAEPLACDACHGAPPPPPHPANTDCIACHAAGLDADGVPLPSRHINGRIELLEDGRQPDCATCHSEPASPPHDVHAAFACSECHRVPVDWLAPGHLEDRGADDVRLGPLAHRGGATPRWDGTSCSSVYCHGGTLAGGASTTIAWEAHEQRLACDACHGDPPPAPHLAGDDCAMCHGEALDRHGAPLPDFHIDGQVQLIRWTGEAGQPRCGECHGIPPEAPHPASSSCHVCHAPAFIEGRLDPDIHMNGQVDQTTAPATEASGGGAR